jgi:hypothetical protein
MASRNISDLSDKCREKYYLFLNAMNKAGLKFIITCTSRSYKEQVALFAQGRQDIDEVNKLRLIAGMAPLLENDKDGKPITYRPVSWTLVSRHVTDYFDHDMWITKSDAFDIALMYPNIPNKVYYDLKVDVDHNHIGDYEEAARIGEKVGLKPGMRFKKKDGSPNPDPAHFEV